MQSLHAARCVCVGAAFACAWLASSTHQWSVIESVGGLKDPHTLLHTHSHSYDRSPTSLTTTVEDDRGMDTEAAALAFAPNIYCLLLLNGTHDCHQYASLLTQQLGGASSTTIPTTTTVIASGRHHDDALDVDNRPLTGDIAPQRLRAATASSRLHAAVGSWCMVASDGSWIVQGAESMLCLVVLETCAYTKLLWLLSGGASVVLAALGAATARRQASGPHPGTTTHDNSLATSIEAAAALFTYAQLALGVLLLLAWWGYALYFLDLGELAMLQLVVRFGVSFRLVTLSVLASMAASRLAARLAGHTSAPFHLARLYHMPSSSSPTSAAAASPTDSDAAADARTECLEAADPLKCPANYRV